MKDTLEPTIDHCKDVYNLKPYTRPYVEYYNWFVDWVGYGTKLTNSTARLVGELSYHKYWEWCRDYLISKGEL